MKNILLTFIYLLIFSNQLFPSQRGVSRVEIKTSSGETVGLYEESHALVIGVSDYTNGWPDLRSVVKDVESVGIALEEHGFQVTKVLNPTKIELNTAFQSFIDQYGFDENNRLLFYFAGHGYTHDLHGRDLGYIVPRDAAFPDKAEKGFLRGYLPMNQIRAWSRQFQAKHALFVFDSCFSGTVLKDSSHVVPQQIRAITAKPVRQFISAGTAGQTVPAQSIFRPIFIRGIKGEADLDKDQYVTATELGLFLQKKVTDYDTGQTPQFGKIKDPLFDEGDFVFKVFKAKDKNKIIKKVRTLLPDQEAWKAISNSKNAKDYLLFIEAFPDSPLIKTAKFKIKLLNNNRNNTRIDEKQIKKTNPKNSSKKIISSTINKKTSKNNVFNLSSMFIKTSNNALAKKYCNHLKESKNNKICKDDKIKILNDLKKNFLKNKTIYRKAENDCINEKTLFDLRLCINSRISFYKELLVLEKRINKNVVSYAVLQCKHLKETLSEIPCIKQEIKKLELADASNKENRPKHTKKQSLNKNNKRNFSSSENLRIKVDDPSLYNSLKLIPNYKFFEPSKPELDIRNLNENSFNYNEPIIVPKSETEPIVPMLEFKETKEPEVSSEFNQKLLTSKKIRQAEKEYNQHIQTMIQPKLAMYDSEHFVRIELEIGVSGKIIRYRILEASPSNAFNQAAQLAVRNVNLDPLPEALAGNPPYIVVVKIIPRH